MGNEARVHLSKSARGAYDALAGFSKTVKDLAGDAGLDARLAEIVQIHASQLNGCAYCVRIHVDRAVEVGLDADVIAQIAVWRESGVFSERERAALQLTESFTFIHEGGITDDVYDSVGAILSEQEYVALSWLLVSINAFNRVAIAGRYPVPPPRGRVGVTVRDEAADPVVSGSMNFRDTGGLPAGVGRSRRGILFRSGNLAHLDDAGRDAMAGLGIRRIIDLRDDDEVRYAPSLIDGLEIDVQRVPLFLGSVASFFERDVSLEELYAALLDESAAGVVEVARGIVTDQPVLVHCTVGKDRTGVTVALALAAAGVDVDAVIADYARTEALLPERRNRDVVARLRRIYPDAVNVEALATRSPAAAMRATLDAVVARHGSPAEYLRAHGLDDAELEELRRVLVEV